MEGEGGGEGEKWRGGEGEKWREGEGRSEEGKKERREGEAENCLFRIKFQSFPSSQAKCGTST